jgi:hypothetical protein
MLSLPVSPKTVPLAAHGPRLVHACQDTGHVGIFGLTVENYRPETVKRAANMAKNSFGGFSITVLGCDKAPRDLTVFTVEQDGESLTMNSASYDPIRRRLTVITRLLAVKPKDAAPLADLAQCVAIGLLLKEWPELP